MGLFTEQTFDEALDSLKSTHQELIRENDSWQDKLKFVCGKERELREEIAILKREAQSGAQGNEMYQELMQSRDSYRDRWRNSDAECGRLQRWIEKIKHEVPCEDCKGGIHGKYCPTCMSWRMNGDRCLDCDSKHIACPTCLGSGLKYFPLVAKATFTVPKIDPPNDLSCGALIDKEVIRVGLERANLYEDAIIKWLDEHGCREYRNLYIARRSNGCEELRVRSQIPGVDDTVLLKLPPIAAGFGEFRMGGGIPTEEES